MSWGGPKCASILRPSCASCTTCASVRAAVPGAPARSPVPVSRPRQGVDGELLGGDRLGDDLTVTDLVDVRVDKAETRASPRPKLASTQAISGLT